MNMGLLKQKKKGSDLRESSRFHSCAEPLTGSCDHRAPPPAAVTLEHGRCPASPHSRSGVQWPVFDRAAAAHRRGFNTNHANWISLNIPQKLRA